MQTKTHNTSAQRRSDNETLFETRRDALAQAAEHDENGNTVQANRARTVAERAEAELFDKNTGLVVAIAKPFRTEGADSTYEEYLDAGKLALLISIRTWDPERAPLSVWVRGPVTKAILTEVGQLDLGVTRYAFAARAAINAARSDLATILNRPPTSDEISAATGLTLSLVRDVATAERRKSNSMSLDTHIGEEKDGETLGQRIAEPETDDPMTDLSGRIWNLNLTSPPCGLGEWAWVRQSGLLGFPPEDLSDIARCVGVSGESVRKSLKRYNNWLEALDMDGLVNADLDMDAAELTQDLRFWFHPEADNLDRYGEQLNLGEDFLVDATEPEHEAEPEPEPELDPEPDSNQLSMF
jgi:DNA-directed RNA polymerase specialized sigma subunit